MSVKGTKLQPVKKPVKRDLGTMSKTHSHGLKALYFVYNSSLISLLEVESLHSSSFIYTHVFFHINIFDLVFLDRPNDTLDPQKPVWEGWGGHDPLAPLPHATPLLACIFHTFAPNFFFCSPFLKSQLYRSFPNNFTLSTSHLSSPGLRGKHSE